MEPGEMMGHGGFRAAGRAGRGRAPLTAPRRGPRSRRRLAAAAAAPHRLLPAPPPSSRGGAPWGVVKYSHAHNRTLPLIGRGTALAPPSKAGVQQGDSDWLPRRPVGHAFSSVLEPPATHNALFPRPQRDLIGCRLRGRASRCQQPIRGLPWKSRFLIGYGAFFCIPKPSCGRRRQLLIGRCHGPLQAVGRGFLRGGRARERWAGRGRAGGGVKALIAPSPACGSRATPPTRSSPWTPASLHHSLQSPFCAPQPLIAPLSPTWPLHNPP